jgi:hypothetical protein
LLARWVTDSGLTLRELATIQPTYRFLDSVDSEGATEHAIHVAAELCSVDVSKEPARVDVTVSFGPKHVPTIELLHGSKRVAGWPKLKGCLTYYLA